MNVFWQFVSIMLTLIPLGIIAGIKFQNYIENREQPTAKNDLVKAIIIIVLGLSVSVFMLFQN